MHVTPQIRKPSPSEDDEESASETSSTASDAFLRRVARAEPRVPPSRRVAEDDASAPADPLIGEVLDEKYRVESLLGRGGMGAVYRATHLGTGRPVAMKVLLPKLTANDDAVERFRREARVAGGMRHPNIVDVTDFGFAERGGKQLAYLVMELLQGTTLRAHLDASGPLPLDITIDVLNQVCAGVGEAHAHGILHRDIKPENVHLAPDERGRLRVKVLDFGIAKLQGGGVSPEAAREGEIATETADAYAPTLDVVAVGAGATTPAFGSGGGELTGVGAAIGTPRYMSPEQWQGRVIDARADVYSLGVLAYEMLAGEPPFLGRKRSIVREHAELTPQPLAERAPAVPRAIASVIEAALAKEPASRPPSARAFAAALQAGTETTSGLLRRSIALTLEQYRLLFRRCLIASIPLLVVSAICVVNALRSPASAGGPSGSLGPSVGAGLLLASTLACLLGAPVSGLLVPLVADLTAAGRSLRPPPTRAEFWRGFRDALPSTLVLHVSVLGLNLVAGLLVGLGAALFAVIRLVLHAAPGAAFPSAAAISSAVTLAAGSSIATVLSILASAIASSAILAPFTVWAPSAVIERSGGLTPLRRSSVLVRPMRRAAFGVRFFTTVLTYALAGLVVLVLKEIAASSTPMPVLTSSAVDLLVISVASALGTPFVLVATALLYLRAREAEGSPLAPGAPGA